MIWVPKVNIYTPLSKYQKGHLVVAAACMLGVSVDVGEALITAKNIASNATDPDVALAQIAFRTVANGNLETRILNQAWQSVSGQWFVSGVETDMELLVTTTSGSPSATPGGWVSGVAEALGTIDKQWGRNQPSIDAGFISWIANYEIFHEPTSTSLSGPVSITLRARTISPP